MSLDISGIGLFVSTSTVTLWFMSFFLAGTTAAASYLVSLSPSCPIGPFDAVFMLPRDPCLERPSDSHTACVSPLPDDEPVSPCELGKSVAVFSAPEHGVLESLETSLA